MGSAEGLGLRGGGGEGVQTKFPSQSQRTSVVPFFANDGSLSVRFRT